MTEIKRFPLALALCAASALGFGTAIAQTTDGFHSIQVFPVVVDSASFTQRFTFSNPNTVAMNITPSYFPGGGAQTTELACLAFSIPAGEDRTFVSLRSICPALAAGSEFGYLYTYTTDAANHPYSGFSRVSNPQGNGFSVEAFAANEFTSAVSLVTGIRRQAATVSNPAFQTNCFVGMLNNFTGSITPTTPIRVTVYNSANAQVGVQTYFNLNAGRLTRLLDVFAAVGAPAGDYLDARAEFFDGAINGSPGVMAFCTTQDNTSFGADFRISKQVTSFGGENGTKSPAPQSDYAVRETNLDQDVTTSGPTFGSLPIARAFEVGTNPGGGANTHLIYFHHPDWVQCEIIDPQTGLRATNAYGLEMRLLKNDASPIAGGNNLQGFGKIYLGDKKDYNGGADGRYTIEVESNGSNTGDPRPYRLHCQSGSGHTLGELIKYQEAVFRF